MLEKKFAPSEDRTHDLQITQFISDYETDALTNCATEAYNIMICFLNSSCEYTIIESRFDLLMEYKKI